MLLGGMVFGLNLHQIELFGLGTLFSGAAWSCLALGSFAAVRAWLSGDRLTERAFLDIQKKARTQHTERLRSLRRSLRLDRDRRTSNMLRQLQKIYDRLLATERWTSQQSAEPIYEEVRVQANNLYASCLNLLERSLQIWKVSREVTTESARVELNQSRESIISEVEQGISNLEQTLDHMQTTQLKGGSQLKEDSIRLRRELDEGLEVARRVEQRMKELEKDIGIQATRE